VSMLGPLLLPAAGVLLLQSSPYPPCPVPDCDIRDMLCSMQLLVMLRVFVLPCASTAPKWRVLCSAIPR
jgi:hypothetical protein